jgi:Immunity protein 50
MVQIINREALEERFGSWPSFHDAEIYAVRLDSGQQSNGRPSIELDIHLFAIDGVREGGRFNFVRHTLATLRFEGVEEVELCELGPQNTLYELSLQDLGPRAPDAARTQVTLPASNGLDGSFRCEDVIVLGWIPFEPGPHSVYSADR